MGTSDRQAVTMNSAVTSATILCPCIIHAVAKAGHGPHDDRLRQLRIAQQYTRELLTRLEIAELEIAAALTTSGGKEAA